MLDDQSLLRLADLNLAEAQREHARFFGPYTVEERDGLLLGACASRFPAFPFNAVSRLATVPDDADDPATLRAEAEGFFFARGRGFGILVRAHLDRRLLRYCEAEGFQRMGNSPGMALTAPVAGPALADGVSLRVVQTPSDAEAFVEVVSAAFEELEMPPKVSRKLLSKPAQWLQPHWHVCLLHADSRPVAGAMLLFSHGIAGIYWVGTLASARGRGYGEAITRAVSQHGFDHGAQAIVLQASPFGEPVYRRIGFREFTHYPWYAVPKPQ
ncbi:MAG: GNAT family N-acetyltransferase [Myxococcales bacterium]|nr:GNAT family N-acetyltransferase [Myxococcales bacterium]